MIFFFLEYPGRPVHAKDLPQTFRKSTLSWIIQDSLCFPGISRTVLMLNKEFVVFRGFLLRHPISSMCSSCVVVPHEHASRFPQRPPCSTTFWKSIKIQTIVKVWPSIALVARPPFFSSAFCAGTWLRLSLADQTLHKKVQAQFGRTITKAACKAFVLNCPICQKARQRRPRPRAGSFFVVIMRSVLSSLSFRLQCQHGLSMLSPISQTHGCVVGTVYILLLFTRFFPFVFARVWTASIGHTPIETMGFGERGQVDMIDMQHYPNDIFKWVLTYVDHGTKFCWATPTPNKKQTTVAYALIRLFSIISPPRILQVRPFSCAFVTLSTIVELTPVFTMFRLTTAKSLQPQRTLKTCSRTTSGTRSCKA